MNPALIYYGRVEIKTRGQVWLVIAIHISRLSHVPPYMRYVL
jgi:hypothetical protein